MLLSIIHLLILLPTCWKQGLRQRLLSNGGNGRPREATCSLIYSVMNSNNYKPQLQNTRGLFRRRWWSRVWGSQLMPWWTYLTISTKNLWQVAALPKVRRAIRIIRHRAAKIRELILNFSLELVWTVYKAHLGGKPVAVKVRSMQVFLLFG